MIRIIPITLWHVICECYNACPNQIPGVGSDLECGRPTKFDKLQHFGDTIDFVNQVEFCLSGGRRTEFRKNSIGSGH